MSDSENKWLLFGWSQLGVKTGTVERQCERGAFALPGLRAADRSSCRAARWDCHATGRHCLPTLTAFRTCTCQSEVAAVPGAGASTEPCPPLSPKKHALSKVLYQRHRPSFANAPSRTFLCSCLALIILST